MITLIIISSLPGFGERVDDGFNKASVALRSTPEDGETDWGEGCGEGNQRDAVEGNCDSAGTTTRGDNTW